MGSSTPQLALALALLMVWVAALSVFIIKLCADLHWKFENEYENRLRKHLWDVFLFISPRKFLLLWSGLSLLASAPILLITGQLLWLGLALLIANSLPLYGIKKYREKRIENLVEQLPDATMMLVTAISSGGSLMSALDFVQRYSDYPLSQELAIVLRKVRLGKTPVDALKEMKDKLQHGQVSRWVSTLRLGISSGGNQAIILSQLATNMRAKKRLENRVKSLSAQGNMQGKVMSLLPFLLASVLFLIEPLAMQELMQRPVGWYFSVSLIVLVVLGQIWIQRLISVQVPL